MSPCIFAYVLHSEGLITKECIIQHNLQDETCRMLYVVLMLFEIDIYQPIDKWQGQEKVRLLFPGFIRAKAKRVET